MGGTVLDLKFDFLESVDDGFVAWATFKPEPHNGVKGECLFVCQGDTWKELDLAIRKMVMGDPNKFDLNPSPITIAVTRIPEEQAPVMRVLPGPNTAGILDGMGLAFSSSPSKTTKTVQQGVVHVWWINSNLYTLEPDKPMKPELVSKILDWAFGKVPPAGLPMPIGMPRHEVISNVLAHTMGE